MTVLKLLFRNWSSSVSILVGYRLNDQRIRIRFSVGAEILLCTTIARSAWVSCSLMSNGYQGLFPWSLKITTHPILLPKVEKDKAVSPFSHPSPWHGAELIN
jgi:hypothetical protein